MCKFIFHWKDKTETSIRASSLSEAIGKINMNYINNLEYFETIYLQKIGTS